MSAKFINPEFEALQCEWYAKLAAEGFEDIEDFDPRTRQRPLKKWSSSFHEANPQLSGFCDVQPGLGPVASSFPEGRYSKEEEFAERQDFLLICENVSLHGNRKLGALGIEILWTYYCDGQTHRQIARKMKTSKQTVARIIQRIQEWMAIL